MNKLTKKDRYGHFYTNKANCRNVYSKDGENLEGVFFENQTLAIDGTAIEKLGKLEDLEEQIGCPLEEMERIDTCLKLATGSSVSCFSYKGKTIACMSVEKYNDLLSKALKNKESE